MDYILIDQDEAVFDPAFGDATVDVRRGTIRASGYAMGDGLELCVEGDEASVVVPGCTYMTTTHTIKGVGTLTIKKLGRDQVASQTTCEDKPVLLVGTTFEAQFTPVTPAQMQLPNGALAPGPTAPYSGTGSFETANASLRGT